ncbi:hypothetical protein Enr13x_18490 [Stieleria neptunia]|uniref:Uncharacterized protein n=1 Tax=Stieleria neptunia TaxID=2527979 RepID=A0A518HMD0_9BACT|nr:hypothetical protein [Stieleria neptunia]QDV42006.1 hypothetical protein Enr13x_18490 [Stieleria neptunia]
MTNQGEKTDSAIDDVESAEDHSTATAPPDGQSTGRADTPATEPATDNDDGPAKLPLDGRTLRLLVCLLPVGGLVVVMIVYLGATIQMSLPIESSNALRSQSLDVVRVTTVLLGGVTLVVTGVSLINLGLMNSIDADPDWKESRRYTPIAGAVTALSRRWPEPLCWALHWRRT